MLAGHLCKQLRWREAYDIYHVLGDREAAAVCLEKLGRYAEAAQRLEELASAREAPRLSEAEEMDLGTLFNRAARLYRAEFRRADFERCKRKANHYIRRPWLVLEIVPPRAIYVERANVLAVVIANQSRGIAYDVKLDLVDQDNTIRFTGHQVIDGIGPLDRSPQQRIQIWPSVSGDITVNVRLTWTERADGVERHKQITLPEPWIIPVSEPGATDRQTPVNYYVEGDLFVDSEVIQGNQYRDHAQHGDRVEINRGVRAGDDGVTLGVACPNPACGVINPIMAAFCDACGTDLRTG